MNEQFYVFHKEIGLPPHLAPLWRERIISLSWSNHAQAAANNDRYGFIDCYAHINLKEWDVIEVKVDKQTLVPQRVLLRSRFEVEDNNICLVLGVAPTNRWRVVTTWINEANDAHSTLNPHNYDRCEDVFPIQDAV